MATDTITLMLEGDVDLKAFSDAIKDFTKLVAALSEREGGDIEWTVEDLAPGSALAMIKGRSRQPERVERVVRSYLGVGKTIQQNRPLTDRKIALPALRLAKMAGRRVTAVRFETAEDEAVISEPPSRRRKVGDDEPTLAKLASPEMEQRRAVYGAIEGEVQTLTKRNGLRFTLYEFLSDKAVSCYLQLGQEEQMRNIWGKRAIIEGAVSRDQHGHPISVRQIANIIPIVEEGDYTQARGILPRAKGDELPEVRIRRIRDE
jgi:hypothetical protein